MLNRSDVFGQLQHIVVDSGPQLSVKKIVLDAWCKAVAMGDEFSTLVSKRDWPFSVPRWFTPLDSTVAVQKLEQSYGVLGVDGSQIYPDRYYSNADCFLINTGGIAVAYRDPVSEVQFFSQPYVHTLRDVVKRYGYDTSSSKDLIDLIREEFEFKIAFLESKKFRESYAELPFLCLFDGSFVFWHLEGKTPDIRELFLSTYMLYLRRFQEAQIPVAGYISLPRSRELCNALRIVLCERFINQNTFCLIDQPCSCKILHEITDVDLVSNFLVSGQRTGIFMSRSSIADQYFDELRPCFFFLNIGSEIGRVELPWWMAKNPVAVDFVAQVVLSQAEKGLGFPMVLAEAHEQAVVKHADKLFFYDVLDTLARQKGSSLGNQIALKNMRKRRMPV